MIEYGQVPTWATIADLKATKERVQQGWCSDGARDLDGNVCVLVAAQQSIHDFNFQRLCDRYTAVADALWAQLPQEYQRSHSIADVGRYNDSPYTVQADIENLIDKTLAELGGLGDDC